MKRDLEFPTRSVPAAEWMRAASVRATAMAVAVILLGFWQTAQSIVVIWIRSETFAHGFVVVPLSLWLAWRKRDTLGAMTAQPWWWGLPFVFASGALWLVSTAANVQVLTQFALVFMLQAAIVTVVGLRIARVLAFPLAFLLFAVPTGEFLMPTLIDHTADFTVGALRLSGIPVYREGNNFIIPSGWWSVVEACSGIRYLIASIMVGTIYAAIAYRSARRRALFLGGSIVVPIIANWIRAYLIVLLGHLSGNKLATGVDLLVSGWLFFGLVMLLLFWVGSFWQERDAPAAAPAGQAPRIPAMASIPHGKLYAAAATAIVAALIWQPVDAFATHGIATAVPAIPRLDGAGGWTRSPEIIADWKPRYSGYAADSQQTFVKGDRRVGLYIAYYRNQVKGSELVTSTNFLVKRGNWDWNEIASSTEPLAWNGRDIAAQRSNLAGRKGKLDVYRLYWIAGHVTANDYVAKAWLAWSKLTGRGDDSALIVVYAQGDEAMSEKAPQAARAFAAEMSPSIDRLLTRVRDGGS